MFYVYELRYNDECLYVGCGKGKRIDHVLSGTSHNFYLNKFVSIGYLEEDIVLHKIYEGVSTKEKILEIEAEYIHKLKPLFNKTCGGVFQGEEYFSDKRDKVEYYLEQHMCNRIFDVLKWKKSEPYINVFKNKINVLENIIEENQRLKTQIKNINVGVY